MALTVTIGQLPNHHACAFQNNTDPLRVPESPEENRVLGILNNQLSETQAQLNTVSLQIDQWEGKAIFLSDSRNFQRLLRAKNLEKTLYQQKQELELQINNQLENELKQYPESALEVLGDVPLGQAEHEAKQSQLNYNQESLQSDVDQLFLGDSYKISEAPITTEPLVAEIDFAIMLMELYKILHLPPIVFEKRKLELLAVLDQIRAQVLQTCKNKIDGANFQPAGLANMGIVQPGYTFVPFYVQDMQYMSTEACKTVIKLLFNRVTLGVKAAAENGASAEQLRTIYASVKQEIVDAIIYLFRRFVD